MLGAEFARRAGTRLRLYVGVAGAILEMLQAGGDGGFGMRLTYRALSADVVGFVTGCEMWTAVPLPFCADCMSRAPLVPPGFCTCVKAAESGHIACMELQLEMLEFWLGAEELGRAGPCVCLAGGEWWFVSCTAAEVVRSRRAMPDTEGPRDSSILG